MKKHILAIFALLLFNASLFAQYDKEDRKAKDLVDLGNQYFVNQEFLDASLSFELASQRPANSLSSYSLYMKGLSYFELEENEKSRAAFEDFLKMFPTSKYAEDAQYHRGIILLKSARTSDRERGLDVMFELSKNASDHKLKKEVISTVQHYLFYEFDASFLDLYYITSKDDHKPVFMEAICFRLNQARKKDAMLVKLDEYEKSGFQLTPYLSSLKEKQINTKSFDSDKLNLAIFLNFRLDEVSDSNSVIPAKSVRDMDIFTGMKLAMDSLGKETGKEINVRVFDTQGDTARVRKQLDSLVNFGPDIIIGEYRTSIAMMISDWAEKHEVVDIIPRNSIDELIKGKKYTFLSHPSIKTHGTAMAKYVAKDMGKRKVLIFNDKSFYSKRFTEAFKAQLDSFPYIKYKEEIVNYDPKKEKFDDFARRYRYYFSSAKNEGYDAVYMPLSNEEIAGYFMSMMTASHMDTDVFGGPDWEMFSVIDGRSKTDHHLRYTSFYYPNNDSLSRQELNLLCLKNTIDISANEFLITGFDVMAWILEISKNIAGESGPADVIRTAPIYTGIHLDFYFNGMQDNQVPNILEYQEGRIFKINGSHKKSGTVQKGEPGNSGGG